jgi:single-stranded DNA-binding protein
MLNVNTTTQVGKLEGIQGKKGNGITFTISNFIQHKDREGNKVKNNSYHTCKAYDHLAEFIGKNASEGDWVSVTGAYIDTQHTTSTGVQVNQKQILCDRVSLMTKKFLEDYE